MVYLVDSLQKLWSNRWLDFYYCIQEKTESLPFKFLVVFSKDPSLRRNSKILREKYVFIFYMGICLYSTSIALASYPGESRSKLVSTTWRKIWGCSVRITIFTYIIGDYSITTIFAFTPQFDSPIYSSNYRILRKLRRLDIEI